MGFIYKITNNINNKVYIGQTKQTIQQRYQKHLECAMNHVNRYLYDAMNCYGYANFSVSQIEECDNSLLDEREKYWIKYYNATDSAYGYNMTEGGGGGNTWENNPHKLETGDKIRESNLGEKYIPITKESLLQDIEQQMSVADMCKKYHTALSTLNNRSKEFFNGKTISELRIIENTGHFKKKEINKEELLIKIKDLSLTYEEIAKYFNVGIKTLRNRSVEYFNKTAAELRQEYMKEKLATYPKHEGKLDETNQKDVNILTELLYFNYNDKDIEEYFNISKKTLYNKIEKIYNISTIKEAKQYVKQKWGKRISMGN